MNKYHLIFLFLFMIIPVKVATSDSALTIEDYILSKTDQAEPIQSLTYSWGEQYTIWMNINNPTNESIEVWLSCHLITSTGDGSQSTATMTINPGTQWYSFLGRGVDYPGLYRISIQMMLTSTYETLDSEYSEYMIEIVEGEYPAEPTTLHNTKLRVIPSNITVMTGSETSLFAKFTADSLFTSKYKILSWSCENGSLISEELFCEQTQIYTAPDFETVDQIRVVFEGSSGYEAAEANVTVNVVDYYVLDHIEIEVMEFVQPDEPQMRIQFNNHGNRSFTVTKVVLSGINVWDGRFTVNSSETKILEISDIEPVFERNIVNNLNEVFIEGVQKNPGFYHNIVIINNQSSYADGWTHVWSWQHFATVQSTADEVNEIDNIIVQISELETIIEELLVEVEWTLMNIIDNDPWQAKNGLDETFYLIDEALQTTLSINTSLNELGVQNPIQLISDIETFIWEVQACVEESDIALQENENIDWAGRTEPDGSDLIGSMSDEDITQIRDDLEAATASLESISSSITSLKAALNEAALARASLSQLWNVTWGGSGIEGSFGVAVASDGIYVAGVTTSYGAAGSDALLLKYDSEGHQLWNTTWGGADFELGYGVVATVDGIYVAGTTDSFGAGGADAFLVKYDSDGHQLWNTTWGGVDIEYGNGVAVASDGIYVTGFTYSYGAGGADAFLVKYDSNGHQLWNTTWGGPSYEYSGGVAIASDGIYVAGHTQSYGAGSADAFLVKYNSSGHQLWNTTWGGPSYESGLGVAVASDGIYVAGDTDSFGAGDSDALLIKYDSSGNQLWNTTWGETGYERGFGLAVAGDGIYITGGTDSYGAGDFDALLLKYDSDGNQLWNTTWGGTGDESGFGLAVAGDGVYVTGHTQTYEVGASNPFLVKYYSEPTAEIYELNITVEGSGTTNLASGTYTYEGGTNVTVESFPDETWLFNHWMLDGIEAGPGMSFNLTMDSNHTLTAVFILGQTQLWNTTWGGTGYDLGYGVAVASDGIYIAGFTRSFGAGGEDIILVKYDSDGHQLWNTTWGGASTDMGYGVAVASDGIYVTGHTRSYGAGGADALLIKYDSDGHQLWNTTWGGASNDYGNAVAVAGDVVYITGYTESYGAGNQDALLITYDSDGNQLWNTTWGGPNYDYGDDVAVTSDGVYVTGFTESYGAGGADAFLVKYDSDGHQLWNTTWGGTSYEGGKGVAVASDGIYVAGFTRSFGAADADTLLIKYDSDGNQLWNTTWGGVGDEPGFGVAVTSDGIYVAGGTDSYGAGGVDVLLIKFDSDGNQLWNTTWGGTGNDYSFSLAVASDGIYVTGGTDTFGIGETDVLLVKYTLSTNMQQINLELRAGWNMVSLPVLPDDPLASSVLSGIGFYQLVTWSGTGYVAATEFEAGRGYWLLVLEDVNVSVSGTSVDSLVLSLSPGWNMVGGTFDEAQAADVFPDFYQLVTWTGTGYTPASTFEPGKGYWALVLEETQIQLPPTCSSNAVSSPVLPSC